jgi:galactokinase
MECRALIACEQGSFGNMVAIEFSQPSLGFAGKRRKELCARFEREFGSSRAQHLFALSVPLRLCPLGAHSDHQKGIVTGFAIDRSIDLVASITDASNVEVASTIFNQKVSVNLADARGRVEGDWANYLRGAIAALRQAGIPLRHGLSAVIDGTMPIGGLSSSAAVCIAYLRALTYAQGVSLSERQLVSFVSQIENRYLGLNNGVLDQSVILFSQPHSLTVIDCRDDRVTPVKIGETSIGWEFLVVYSGVSRQLTATPFNQRVAECQTAARELLKCSNAPIANNPVLGDVSQDVYERYAINLPDTLRRRACHFFEEQDRVKRGVQAWSKGDLRLFGELITQSGHSSIAYYESGSPALIALYEILADIPGVYGTRFCGGGFQGCCLALIDPAKRDSIAAAVDVGYSRRFPEYKHSYSIHRCQTTTGGPIEEVR